MSELTKAALTAADQQQRDAYKRYAELVMDGKATAENTAEFRGLIADLGRTPDRIRTDQELLAKVHSLLGTIRAGSGLSNQIIQATAGRDAYEAETRCIVAERTAKTDELRKAYALPAERQGAAICAARELEELKSRNVPLLRHIEVPTRQQIEQR